MRALPLAILALVVLGPAWAGCLSASPDLDAAGGAADVGLSPAVFEGLVREPLRVESSADGETLRVDVYRPEGDGPFPTILVQSPYWSYGSDAKTRETPTWYVPYFVPRGYAVALGEMRGTRDSGGCWDFGGPLDQQDGHDVVEALAAAPWSNGRVGMLGQSHVGMSQIAAAVTAPEHLTTIVPIAAVSDWYRYLHKDGAPYVLNRATPPAYFAVHASPSTEAVSPDWALTQARIACDDNVVHVSQSADVDGDKDAYWQERDLIAKAGNVRASVFLVHGFLDENVKTDHFLDFWQALPEDVPRKMWLGQWYHAHPSFYEWRDDLHRWFDYWLMGIENGVMDDPVVTVQDNTEAARWETGWPPASTVVERWMPHEGLGPEKPGDTTVAVSYVAVPGDDRGFTPMRNLATVRAVVFDTEPLASPLRIVGEPVLELEGALDGPAGRWIAVLVDVAPDGTMDEITRAYLDARHRDSLERGADVPPGEMLTYTLRFFPRDHVVAVDHTLQLRIIPGDMGCGSSIGPVTSQDRDCEGTGILPVERVVTHTVATGPGSATRLLLPVPAEDGPERVITELDGWLEDLPE